MTASVPTSTMFAYSGDGMRAEFSFPLRFLENPEVVVMVDGATKVIGTHYAIEGAGEVNGGVVTFNEGEEPAAGTTVALYRDTAPKQTINLTDTGRTPGDTLEAQLDRFALVDQDIRERVSDLETNYDLAVGPQGDPGVVQTIAPGIGIAVDDSNPTNPEVALSTAALASLSRADSAVQSIVAGDNVAVDATDPNNPIISSTAAGSGGFGDLTQAAAYAPASAPDFMRVEGYAAAGDGGGALYAKAASEPSHEGKFFITLDDAVTVVWFEIAEDELRPEHFGYVSGGADAGPAWRDMIDAGLALGRCKFRGRVGETYLFASPDPEDASDALAIYRTGIAIDMTFDMTGATLEGSDDIQETTDPGAIIRLETSVGVNLKWLGGEIDLTNCTASTPSVPTIGGLALQGFNTYIDGVFVNHGTTTASGDAIGVGGGDQSLFITGYPSAVITGCRFRGAPDLGLYLSSSGGRHLRATNNKFYRCQNGIGLKRYSGEAIISDDVFEECDIGINNPVADGATDNHGGKALISDNIFKKIQSRPIDLAGTTAAGSIVSNNRFADWGRRISDAAENSTSERLAAIRIRSPNCQVLGNWAGMVDWSLNTTSGKEQIGVRFGIVGSVSNADDCQANDNMFVGLYQKIVYDSSTSRCDARNNKGIGITTSDADSGDNIFFIRLLDDKATSILAPSNRAIALFETQTTGSGSPNGTVHCNTSGSPATTNVALSTTTNITLTTGSLSDAGGTDGNFMISSHTDGKIYLSNRTGGTKLLRVTFPGR